MSDISSVASDPPDYGSFDVYSEPDSPALSYKSVGIDLSQHNSAELEPNAVSPSKLVVITANTTVMVVQKNGMKQMQKTVEPFTNARQPHAPRKESAFIEWMAILIFAFQCAFFLPNPAAELVLLLLRTVLSVLSVLCPHPFLAGVFAIFPASLYLAWKQFSSDRCAIHKFVVCPNCNAIYKYSNAIEKIGTHTVSKCCTYTEYPNRSQAGMRSH